MTVASGKWVATFTPDMNLYVVNNSKSGQVLSTIALSPIVHTWKWADNHDTPNKSYWILGMESSGKYTITKEE